MKRGETYSSGWLKAQDMLDQGHADGLTLTIKGVRSHKMDDGKTQRVLSFHEDDRELGLNQTNWDAVAEVTGKNDDDEWTGFKVHCYPHKLDRPYQGYTHGMRVKAPVGSNSNRSGAEIWTLEVATQKCMDAGIQRSDLIARLKSLGNPTYVPQRDTAAVKAFIDERQAETTFDDIPDAQHEEAL